MKKKVVAPFQRQLLDAIVRRKVVNLFLALDKDYVLRAAKKTDSFTHSHAHKIACLLLEHKLLRKVEGNTNKRSHYMEFTPKGREAAELLRKIVSGLEGR